MLFVDYFFELLDDGTIIMDEELKAHQIDVKNGDRFVAQVTMDGRVMFKKVEDGRSSGAD
jgi:hypothetical protein